MRLSSGQHYFEHAQLLQEHTCRSKIMSMEQSGILRQTLSNAPEFGEKQFAEGDDPATQKIMEPCAPAQASSSR